MSGNDSYNPRGSGSYDRDEEERKRRGGYQ
jgi:hypothetical protein